MKLRKFVDTPGILEATGMIIVTALWAAVWIATEWRPFDLLVMMVANVRIERLYTDWVYVPFQLALLRVLIRDHFRYYNRPALSKDFVAMWAGTLIAGLALGPAFGLFLTTLLFVVSPGSAKEQG